MGYTKLVEDGAPKHAFIALLKEYEEERKFIINQFIHYHVHICSNDRTFLFTCTHNAQPQYGESVKMNDFDFVNNHRTQFVNNTVIELQSGDSFEKQEILPSKKLSNNITLQQVVVDSSNNTLIDFVRQPQGKVQGHMWSQTNEIANGNFYKQTVLSGGAGYETIADIITEATSSSGGEIPPTV